VQIEQQSLAPPKHLLHTRRLARMWRMGGNWPLITGLVLVLMPLVASFAARVFLIGPADVRLGANLLGQHPSWAHPLGTDNLGRDMLAVVLYSTPPTLEVGLIAGIVATAVGAILGLLSGYYRGWIDWVVRALTDVALGIPSLVVLVVIAALLGETSLKTLALIIALFAWPFSARTVRAQVLALREQPYVMLSKLSRRTNAEIMFLEILPNLLPYLMATLLGAISGAILAEVGLQLIGLAPVGTPTLGLMLQSAFQAGALSQGIWWWWGPPAAVLALLFLGLFLVSTSVDRIANPRLKGLS
jgi:peptide/nickel transport system permease protein